LPLNLQRLLHCRLELWSWCLQLWLWRCMLQLQLCWLRLQQHMRWWLLLPRMCILLKWLVGWWLLLQCLQLW